MTSGPRMGGRGEMVDETSDGAVRAYGPPSLAVQHRCGVYVERIGVQPMEAKIVGDVRTVWTESDPAAVLNANQSGAITAGELH